MKNKSLCGHSLTNQEMKQVIGGYLFKYSEHGCRCPACGKWVETTIYTSYIVCPHCGYSVALKEKKGE